MKYCIYTRLYYESPYILFFIEHYIKLGFDKIIILKSDNIIFNNTFENNVDIYNVNNDENKLLSIYTKFIKNTKYDWVLIVDIDEILFLNPKYNTINDYVQNKLIKNSDINTFYFRWAMLEKYDNFEYIVVYTLSNDSTWQIIKKYIIFGSGPCYNTNANKDVLATFTRRHLQPTNPLLWKKNAMALPTGLIGKIGHFILVKI